MPNFKSISFKMAVLKGGRQDLPYPYVCYPKDPMWNRVKGMEVVMATVAMLNWNSTNAIIRASRGLKTFVIYIKTISCMSLSI